jgi:purine catabolism regulator
METTGGLTVAELAATASLESRFLAGEQGGDRRVLWAHSCEMPNPENWLGPHELLMTVGLCVPADAIAQVAFIERLNNAGLAGIMIGDHTLAPPLTQEMLDAADRCDFPVLLVAEQVPYAVVARHVAAANSHEQTLQVLTLSKMYHTAAYADEDGEDLVGRLEQLLRIGIRVTDVSTGIVVVGTNSTAANPTKSIHDYDLHGAHKVTLTITEFAGESIDSFILVHLMKILEVVVDRILNSADRRAEVSARLMLSLLNGVTLPETNEFLAPHLPSDGFVLVSVPVSDGRALSRLLAVNKLPVIAGLGRITFLALVPSGEIETVRGLFGTVSAHAGVSSVFTDFADTRAAAVEAGKVLSAAQHNDRIWTEFDGSTVSVLTRSHREATEIVQGVLGPLADESTRSTMLRDTLFAFLRNDRKWKETADELFIHKQTLSYRLGRIEEQTGLKIGRSADLSSLWIAYQAWETISPKTLAE